MLVYEKPLGPKSKWSTKPQNMHIMTMISRDDLQDSWIQVMLHDYYYDGAVSPMLCYIMEYMMRKTMSYEQFQCYMLTMFSQSITHDMIYAKYMLHENLFHEMDFHYVMHFMIFTTSLHFISWRH